MNPKNYDIDPLAVYSDEEVIKGTLEWCNQIRQIQGKTTLNELPQGVVGDPSTCPCGSAIDLQVGTKHIRSTIDEIIAPLPEVVQSFVFRFDRRYAGFSHLVRPFGSTKEGDH